MALVHVSDMPNTVEGNALGDNFRDLEVLYRKIEEGKYEFAGYYNPDVADEEYPDGMIAVKLGSVYGGTGTVSQGTAVWNAEGSGKDPLPRMRGVTSWISLWEHCCGNNYTKKCYVKGSPTATGVCKCNQDIQGGHMICVNKKPEKGSNDVFIIPICGLHNNPANKNQMTVCGEVGTVILNKFLMRE